MPACGMDRHQHLLVRVLPSLLYQARLRFLPRLCLQRLSTSSCLALCP